MKPIYFLAISLSLIFTSCQSYKNKSNINHTDLKTLVEKLCNDEYAGRKAGSEENQKAAKYLAYQFSKSKLENFGEWMQEFEIQEGYELDKTSSLKLNKHTLEAFKDFGLYPFVFQDSVIINRLLFCNYGIEIKHPLITYSDYNADVKDKWLLIKMGIPEEVSNKKIGVSELSKINYAHEKGAKGIVFISENNQFPNLDLSNVPVAIPALIISSDFANQLLTNNKTSIDSLKTGTWLNAEMKGNLHVKERKVKLMNVMAYVQNPESELKDEFYVLGAHFDHLGLGGENSSSRSPETLAIHHGADDNASGVSAVIEIAGKLKANAHLLKRSVLFVLFDGEEKGLLGSKHFVNNLPVKKENIKGMVNLDMVGRLKVDSSLLIGGVGSSLEIQSIIEQLNDNFGFKLGFSQEGYGPSDHAPFYANNIPVLYITSGAHQDYHTPNDLPEKLNYEGLCSISELVYQSLILLSTKNEALSFKEAGPRTTPSRHGGKFNVSLGIMPDAYGIEKRGLKADFVVEGKPAALGGMKTGDIITKINGKPVSGIKAYMEWLSKLKPGEQILVDIIRNDKNEVLTIQL